MRPVFKSKNEAVYDALRQSIIQGEYEPGSRLVIDDLAATMGVSQIPIREALRQLEADGFITIEPYVGATLTEINANFIFEIFALLESLEVICSRTACRCMSEREMEKLGELIDRMDDNINHPELWSQDNKQLHLFVCECSKNVLSTKMTHKVLDHWDRLRLHYLKDVFGHRIADAQNEHKQILTAFRSRNPDAVEQAVRQHNQNALQSYLKHLHSKGQIQTSKDGCP